MDFDELVNLTAQQREAPALPEPASAVDLAKVWENVPIKPFFSPEDIKAAGGFEKLWLNDPAPTEFMGLDLHMYPTQERVFTSARRMGKSVMQEEYFKAGPRTASALRGKSATFTVADELGGLTREDLMETIARLNGLGKAQNMAKLNGGTPPLSPEAVAALEYMAQQMTNLLGTMSPGNRRVTLNSPHMLTVGTSNGYKKVNHIGGEEFEMTGVRVGSPKKGHQLIFEFRPTAVAAYSSMEMTQSECESLLNDWRMLVDVAAGSNFYVALDEVRKVDAAKLQEIENQRLAQEYGEFGAW